MDMVTEYPQFALSARSDSTRNGTDARLRAPGRGRTAARHPIGIVGRVVRVKPGARTASIIMESSRR